MSTKLSAPPSAAASSSVFIRPLASCHASERTKALKSLIAWLPTQDNISDDEMKRLWKSLFYSVWHCDKLPNQVNLIHRLSSLLLSLSQSLSLLYFSHFLLTMRREWTGIDGLRLDKFYLLIRVFMRHFFMLMKKGNWDLGVLGECMRVLEQRVLSPVVEDRSLGYGVTYHIVSVFLQELKAFLPLGLDVLNVLFEPFVLVLGRTESKVLISKVKSDVFDYLLKNGRALLDAKSSGADLDPTDEIPLLGTVALVMKFSTRFYDLGSAPDCVQGNRKALFDLHKMFSRLEKDLESSGIEILIPNVTGVDDGEQVPSLIPINDRGVNGSRSEDAPDLVDDPLHKANKKRKKDKRAAATKSKKTTKKGKLKGAIDLGEANNDVTDAENVGAGPADQMKGITFNESVISNLQMQFEKIANEAGLDEDGTSSLGSPTDQPKGKVSKKRKRAKTIAVEKKTSSSRQNGEGDGAGDNAPVTGERSVKKVRFSMKNNLVWKPHTPLPPQSLRIPPSVTPRGSALKKGIPPGPVREVPPEREKMKRKLKKPRRLVKSASPAVKCLRKLITRSL